MTPDIVVEVDAGRGGERRHGAGDRLRPGRFARHPTAGRTQSSRDTNGVGGGGSGDSPARLADDADVADRATAVDKLAGASGKTMLRRGSATRMSEIAPQRLAGQ
jgi:hypothetical protein